MTTEIYECRFCTGVFPKSRARKCYVCDCEICNKCVSQSLRDDLMVEVCPTCDEEDDGC
jgi:hypothetical protein